MHKSPKFWTPVRTFVPIFVIYVATLFIFTIVKISFDCPLNPIIDGKLWGLNFPMYGMGAKRVKNQVIFNCLSISFCQSPHFHIIPSRCTFSVDTFFSEAMKVLGRWNNQLGLGVNSPQTTHSQSLDTQNYFGANQVRHFPPKTSLTALPNGFSRRYSRVAVIFFKEAKFSFIFQFWPDWIQYFKAALVGVYLPVTDFQKISVKFPVSIDYLSFWKWSNRISKETRERIVLARCCEHFSETLCSKRKSNFHRWERISTHTSQKWRQN